MRQKIILASYLFIASITIAYTADITIDAGAPAKPIRFHNFYGGYHHKEFYYERSTALKRIHDIFKQCAHKRPTIKYCRFQNLFTYRNDSNSSDGLRYATEKISGHCYDTERYKDTGGYNWSKVDEVFDEIVNRAGLIPVVEFNYMPECMAADPNEVGAWGLSIISPPRDHNEWSDLIRNTVLHFQKRYDVQETRKWYFGVWNEPNYREFWRHDKYGYDGFIKLYDYSSIPLKQVDSQLRIGGPDNTSVKQYSKRFVEHTHHGTNYCTGEVGSPCDYFSIHCYGPNPRVTCTELWEMAGDVKAAYGEAECYNKKFLVTECAPHWKSYNVPYLQNRYTTLWWLGLVDIFLEAADIHGEYYLPKSIHYCGIIKKFGGRSLMVQVNGDEDSDEVLKTAFFNVFEALSFLSEERIPVHGCDFPSRFLDVTEFGAIKFKQIRCLATRTPGKSIEVAVYHFDQDDRLVVNENDDGENPAEPFGTYKRATPLTHEINLTINNIPFRDARIKKYVIDKDHSNSSAYRTMHGDTDDYGELDAHDDLEQTENKKVVISNGQYMETFRIQQNSMTLIIIENENSVPGPTLGVSPESIDFGNRLTSSTFTITNHGDAILNWSAIENPEVDWITSIVPAIGALNMGTSETVTLTIDRAGLTDGNYSGSISIASNGGNENVNISMQVGTPAFESVHRINAGGGSYTDTQNQVWSPDRMYTTGGFGFEGGEISSTNDPISGTPDGSLYQSERYDMDAYRFDVPNGRYQVVLHFAEIYFESASERKMSVTIEAETKLRDLDIYAQVGHDAALKYTFPNIVVSDGRLDIEFSDSSRMPKISAIEVIKINSNDTEPPQPPQNVIIVY